VLEKAAPTVPREKVERFTQVYLDTVEFVIVKVTPKHMVTFDCGKDKIYSNLTKTYLE
jgi:hypothetical protein